MKTKVLHTILILIAAFLTVASHASGLPKMANDGAVTRGTLPNGMCYYVVSNSTSKGSVDFALVQRTGALTSDEINPSDVAKDVLSFIPNPGNGISPQAFFSSNGVNPSKDGFVKVDKNHTIYRFSDLLISSDVALLDSALVVMMGMADKLAKSSEPVGKWYAASDNAIIISGDIDSKSVVQKLKTLSYMTPARASQSRKAYVWKADSIPQYNVVVDSAIVLSEVRATWKAPRVPEKYVGTIQPYIQKMCLFQLGEIAVSRIKKNLTEEGVPYATVLHRHHSSADGEDDELFTIDVVSSASSESRVIAVIAETMASLESDVASRSEVEISRKKYIRNLRDALSCPLKSNADYLDLCIRSFLYDFPIVKDADVLKVYTSHSVTIEREQHFLKDVAAALLDPQKNLTVECVSNDDLTPSEVQYIFEESWENGKIMSSPPSIFVSDTLYNVSGADKVGIRSTRKDPVSGGVVWTFANGFKVVYKKMDTAGQVYWSLGLNSGFADIPDLKKGQGAFITDQLWLTRIAGMTGKDFHKFLELNNISMNAKVNVATTVLSGTVENDNIRLLFRALSAVANEREPDPEAFSQYRRNEELRLIAAAGTHLERRAVIDSLMCPDYNYSPVKSRGKLSDDVAEKANSFFEKCFSRMNNGALVMVGDIDEDTLRKELQMQVGAFGTKKAAFYRPTLNYQPVSGWSTYVVDGNENAIYVALSVPMILNAQNKMASDIAAMVLKKSISAAIEATGMYVELVSNTVISPQERFNVMISIKEASSDGFATGMDQSGALEALRIVRLALRSLETTQVTDSVVKAYKEWLKNDLTSRMKDPSYWINAISLRYLSGKDFSTDYKDRIDAVTTAQVRQILTSLNNASKVEYIIKK